MASSQTMIIILGMINKKNETSDGERGGLERGSREGRGRPRDEDKNNR